MIENHAPDVLMMKASRRHETDDHLPANTPDVGPVSQVPEKWVHLTSSRPAGAAMSQTAAFERPSSPRSWIGRALGAATEQRNGRTGRTGQTGRTGRTGQTSRTGRTRWHSERGERSEQLIARQLDRLPRDWKRFRPAPIGDGHCAGVDHLVISPAGVFSVHAKHHKDGRIWVTGDRFWANGRHQPHIHDSRQEAARVGRWLSTRAGVSVKPVGVIVVVNAASFRVKQQPEDVHVVDRLGLRKWLLSLPAVLGPGEVDEIFEAALRSAAWLPE